MNNITFRDNNQLNFIVNIPVLDQEQPLILRMWVAYDKGRRCSQYDYSTVERGYYLYFSFETPSDGYPARTLSIDGKNCRLFLGEVERKKEKDYREFAELAEKIAVNAIELYYPNLKLDWDNVTRDIWLGDGSGVGMYCDFYRVCVPTPELINNLQIADFGKTGGENEN